ncbi:MAG: thioredoxin family protein [Muribaculaceae bacterium]|nr:thioredoxin family protein [Muribaculaceae bacterium]
MTRLIRMLMFALCSLAAFAVSAQMNEPIKWSPKFDIDGDKAVLTLTASIESGWHLYATELPIDDGPEPTSITFTSVKGMEATGELTAAPEAIQMYEEMFSGDVRFWENAVTLTQNFIVTDPNSVSLTGEIYFMACNDVNCLAPTTVTFAFGEAEKELAAAAAASGDGSEYNPTDHAWWTPVEAEGETPVSESSLLSIFIWGFLGGLLALITPCVWPMIPLTVSFFLKKNGTRGKSIREALIYGASIVVIYLVLGLLITVFFGASKLNDLSTNAVFNLIFFALLVVFAISFFGAFDIKLPSRWTNSMDSKAESTTGLLSIFFMAFTLVLVSFSCTGPIIGTLLVEAATQGNLIGPAVGMGAFALALAIPFALFAIFPSWLKEMPRSGGWLNSVKVVLGFLELALSLKFLSVADLAYGWHILDREVFVSLWVVIFTLLGLYLLGKIRFPHDSPVESTGVGRFFMSLISLSFAVYLLPGLWGAPLKSVSAFVPPLFTQDFNLYEQGEYRVFDDYEEGMRYAADNNRPVLMDFSGFGCVNCRKMEGAVFDTDEISSILGENFVVIELMVDDKTPLPRPFTVQENGKSVTISTIGEKWSYLQRYKFHANSQPYYIVLDNDGNALSGSAGYDEDIPKFKNFLEEALQKY